MAIRAPIALNRPLSLKQIDKVILLGRYLISDSLPILRVEVCSCKPQPTCMDALYLLINVSLYPSEFFV